MLQSGGELVLSDTTPTFARTNYYPNTGLDLSALFASYAAIYRNQLWVYVVVSKRARATARLPLKVYSKSSAGRVSASDTPYGRLIARPNPRMDPFFFWAWTSSTFDVYGEAIWLKVRGANGQPRELWPVHPSLIQIHRVPNETTGLMETWYAYLGGMAATVPVLLIPEADVVHFKSYNPDTTMRGMSPLEPLRQTIVNEDAARRASSAFWANGARPSVWLSMPGTLKNKATADRLKADWENLHRGVDNFGKTALLEEGITPHTLSLTAEEAQYESSRKLNREEVCACYDMPPPAVHILDRATFSNITEQFRSVYRDTMAPHLGGFEATMHQQLAADFGDDSLYAEFLMDEVLRGDFEARMAAHKDGIGFGVLMPAEARTIENLPDAGPDTHRLFINSTIIPIDATSSRTSATEPVSDVPLKGLTAEELGRLMGQLSNVKDIAAVNPDRLTAGLNGKSGPVLDALAVSSSVAELRSNIKALAATEVN